MDKLSKLLQDVDMFYKMAEGQVKPFVDSNQQQYKDTDGKPLFLDEDEDFDSDELNLLYQNRQPVPFNKIPYFLKKKDQVNYIKPFVDSNQQQYKDVDGKLLFIDNANSLFYQNRTPVPSNKLPYYLKSK
jgi:hypothetical protein